jgi:hypothetical protein
LTALATESRNARPLAGLICIVAIATFIATLIRLVGSPMRFDEAEWAPQAIGILGHGVPKLLYSEESVIYYSPQMYLGFDAHYGMWHPPVYLYSLAATAGLFGTGNVAMRATGLAWFLLSLVVVWKIAGILLPKGTPRLLRAVPVALIVMTPLLMEGALFLDIDNTSLLFAILLLLWLYLRDPDTVSPRRLALLAVGFAFALASKMTAPYMLLASIGLYQLFRSYLKQGVLQAMVIGFGGTAIFGVAYLAYCALLRYPIGFMFEVSYLGKSGQFLANHGLIQTFHSIHWNLTWISPPIALLIAIAIAGRAAAFVTTRRAQPVDLLLIFCVVGLLAYVPWAGTLGKYTVPPVAAGVLVAGIELSKRFAALERPALRRSDVLVAGGAAAAALILMMSGPPLQFRPPGSSLAGATSLGQVIGDQRNLYLGLTLVAFPLLLFAARRLLRDRARSEVWAVAAVAFLLAANPIAVAKLAVVAQGSTPYRAFNEPGFDATVAFLNASRSDHPDEVILVPKDMGLYFSGRHYNLESVMDIHSGGGIAQVKDVARQPDVRYVVDSTSYATLPGLDGLMSDASLREVKRIGAFVVYENPGYNGA